MRLDEFESVFRSAVKPHYELRRPPLRRIAVLTDHGSELTETFQTAARAFVTGAATDETPSWSLLKPGAETGISTLLADLARTEPDLVITHRHVLSHWQDTPHAIGSAIAVLTQSLSVPILMLPSPSGQSPLPTGPPARALVATQRLVDDAALVDWALHLTQDNGTVVLAHVEDASICARYLDAIARIAGIDSDLARELLPAKLQQLSRDYIGSVLAQMQAHGVSETLHAEVRFGNPLAEFESMIESHRIDLLIGASSEQQDAAPGSKHARGTPINGRTFALATEFAHLPVLFV